MWSIQILRRTSIFPNKDKPQTLWCTHSVISLTEEKNINRTEIYRGRDRISLTDELYPCDDLIIYTTWII